MTRLAGFALPPPHHYFTRLRQGLSRGTAARQAEGNGFSVRYLSAKSMRKSAANSSRSCGSATASFSSPPAFCWSSRVGGWRAYEWWEAKKAAEAGAAFQAAIALASEGKNKEAEEAFAKFAADGTSSYRMLAKFREAAELARRDPKAAVAIYDQLAADSSLGRVLQDLAALRAGTILVDTAPYSEIVQRLEPLTAPDRTFRHSARSMLALAAWRAKDTTAMRKWSDMILADAETPSGTRGQIQMLLALVGRRQEELRPRCATAGLS